MNIITRLENIYKFECEAGVLGNCKDWQELKVDIECAVKVLKLLKNEFEIAGKAKNYIGNVYINQALGFLGVNNEA